MADDRTVSDESVRPGAAQAARRAGLVCLKVAALAILLVTTTHGLLDCATFFITTRRYVMMTLHLAIWVTAILSLLIISFALRPRTRCLWSVPVILSALSADIYYSILGAHLNMDSAVAFWNMRFWVGDVIGNYGFLMTWPLLRALLLFAIFLLPPVLPRLRHRFLALLPFIPILLGAGVVYRTGGYGVACLPIHFSTLSLGGMLAGYNLSTGEREPVDIPTVRPRAIQNLVLIVDESIRGDFIDLADPAGPTPYLASIRNRVISFGVATSGSNCSQESNAILRMGANPRTLGMNGDNIMLNPSIWKYANVAGYETTFLDAQATGGILVDYMNQEEKSLVDHFAQVTAPESYEKDRVAAGRIREMLRADRPQFIFLIKMGAHYNYEQRYPPGSGPFQPTTKMGAAVTDRRLLLNSYRNAIRWSVDQFFSELLQDLDLQDTVVIYTSDHGQNLLEDGNPVTHCRPAPTVYEAMVPLLVITQNGPLLRRFKEAAGRNENRTSHFQIFPTILELFGYDPDSVRREYYLTLFDDVPTRIGVTSGVVFGRFGVPPRWTPLPEDFFAGGERSIGGSRERNQKAPGFARAR